MHVHSGDIYSPRPGCHLLYKSAVRKGRRQKAAHNNLEAHHTVTLRILQT